MDKYFGFLKILLIAALALVYLLFLAPWNKGEITVAGSSKMDQAPQIANFSASVTISDDNKDTAVSQVNTKMTDLIAALKAFGIADSDIKTQNVSVYENQKPEILTGGVGQAPLIYPPRPDTGRKQWTASNSIEIKLRDTSKASALADLLNKSGATAVSGPNFTIEDTKSTDAELLKKAVEDAKSKAEVMAKAGGRSLGRMMSVAESGSGYPYPMALTAERANSVPIEPGMQTPNKSVTATFEIW